MEEEHFENGVKTELSVDDVYLLYRSVSFHLDKWPGGDPYEQEAIMAMKTFLYRIILEAKFHSEE